MAKYEFLTNKSDTLDRWVKHFNVLLNWPSPVSHEALDVIPQRQILEKLVVPPTLDKVTTVIKQISSGESPGVDGIPVVMHKYSGIYRCKKLTQLYKRFGLEGAVRQGFKDLCLHNTPLQTQLHIS